MKIVDISDLHGVLDFAIPPCDVLCICGDIVPLNIQSYTKETFKWLETEFLPWCNWQPCETILLVGGNHDLRMCSHEDKVRALFNETKVHYLLDESYEYIDTETGNVVKFYGTPWCHIFGNWAFMISDDAISEKLRSIPDFPAKLAGEIKHCIVAHHGELEFGSPKKPALIEALVLSMADNLDAKIEQMTEIFNSNESDDWLGFNRLLESNIRKTSR